MKYLLELNARACINYRSQLRTHTKPVAIRSSIQIHSTACPQPRAHSKPHH